ncbi:spore cortex biosynthesis protein YabQ [Thermosyntropha lipolytica DSM 11003]|uniref:Spore cortex biosynthesis protein YabQ n=1 Tax=Thermosyntropha lipolytica DSM 11003 TaxID=1123382 RepID=A0A1M5JTU3_9FIRM|nr:spore cortex biosynthesis protein YabQ [Thermosyntropha lipolytica]SHG43679.1 spore cortex biosynthesis protein YabQ [Thermosyntropha lipolytica DSM 11003]
MSSLVFQIECFAATLALGILAGFFFHFYQGIITRAKVGNILLYVLDFFLWIIMIGLVFFLLLFINGGEIRAYILLALLAGMVIYLSYFSHRLKKFIDGSAEGIVHSLGKLAIIIKKPWLGVKKWLAARPKPPADEE